MAARRPGQPGRNVAAQRQDPGSMLTLHRRLLRLRRAAPAGRVVAATHPARPGRPVAGELGLAGGEGVVVALD